MSQTVELRLLHEPAQIIHVMHEAFARYKDDAIPSSALSETVQSLQQEMQAGIEVFGTMQHNEIIAIVKVEQKTDMLYFSRLSVLPVYQGQGIASALVNELVQVAQLKGLSIIQCKVRKSENANIALYEKLGYKIVSEEETVSKTGFSMPTVTMEKGI
jgi:ribosomal protein S18 acetylase RimI-like enzyme